MSLESFSYRNHASRTDITVSVFFLFLLDSAFAEARIWFSEALCRQESNEKIIQKVITGTANFKRCAAKILPVLACFCKNANGGRQNAENSSSSRSFSAASAGEQFETMLPLRMKTTRSTMGKRFSSRCSVIMTVVPSSELMRLSVLKNSPAAIGSS